MKNKHAVLKGNKQFEIETVDFPPVNGSPIIRVVNVGICGSDTHIWAMGSNPEFLGLTPGHEYSGIIVEPGNSGLSVGDRVVGYTQNPENDPCGTCEACLRGDFDNCTKRKVNVALGCRREHPGAYSEYITWYPHAVFKLPDNVSFEEAAMIEPSAVGLHAVKRSGIQPGAKVLVMGGGIIGCVCADWCRAFGADYIMLSDISPEKREVLKKLNVADEILAAEDEDLADQILAKFPDGIDVVMDCCCFDPTVALGLKVLKRDGTMVGVGVSRKQVSLDIYDLVMLQKKIIGSKGHVADEFKQVLQMLSEGKISLKRFVTAKYPLDEVQTAFEDYRTNQANIKVMIDVTEP